MSPTLHYLALIKHIDPVRALYRAQSMRNRYRSARLHGFFERTRN